ncbi:MAG: hypothetical protein ACK4M9_16780 [Anaerobacillus sp.]|uniref:hypothetical protein n=1 Tax=Anaerobacillus sp. TaxID=1872506 RepID=UPI00391A3D3F
MDNEQLLKIILERFDNLDLQFNNVDRQFKNIDSQFKNIDSHLNNVELQFKVVLSRLDRIEKSQQEDVKDTLHLITKKVDRITYDVDYLSEKIGKHDTKINSLEKRIQS